MCEAPTHPHSPPMAWLTRQQQGEQLMQFLVANRSPCSCDLYHVVSPIEEGSSSPEPQLASLCRISRVRNALMYGLCPLLPFRLMRVRPCATAGSDDHQRHL